MSDEQKTYSIALRVRRTICEDAYIAVPVTNAVTKKKEDGSVGIDFDALVAEALRLSKDSRVEWKEESCVTDPHPTQQTKPEGRTSFDGFYELSE
jgi:hypothetical protein